MGNQFCVNGSRSPVVSCGQWWFVSVAGRCDGLVDAPDFLTLEEAAQILRIGRNQAYELARVWRARAASGVAGGGVRPAAAGAQGGVDATGRAGRAAGGRIVSAEPDGCRLRLDSRALGLGYRLGSDTLLVLLDLAAHATDSPEGIVVAASYRDIARRLGVSKDTVGRRMAVLRHAGVVVELAGSRVDRFETRSYRLYLDFAGVTRERRGSGRELPGRRRRRIELGMRCCCRPNAGRCGGLCGRWCG